jgi:hypothetical protein
MYCYIQNCRFDQEPTSLRDMSVLGSISLLAGVDLDPRQSVWAGVTRAWRQDWTSQTEKSLHINSHAIRYHDQVILNSPIGI